MKEAKDEYTQVSWANLSYRCLSEGMSLTRRRAMQLVAFLEACHVLEVRRGHGRGHVNFYRILDEETGLPVPHKREKKVKSATPPLEKKVKFPTLPEPEKVKSETCKSLESLKNVLDKVVDTKEREDKEQQPVSLSFEKAERLSPYWCEAHSFCHGERLPDHRPDCARER